MHPDIILLNGTSSAGKSSIARALQRRAEIPLIHVSRATPEACADQILAFIRHRAL